MELLCPWESPSYLIFSSNIPTLLYYSHFVAILAALIFALVLGSRARESSSARWFLVTIILFSTWAIIDVLLWASNRPDIVLFYWNVQILLEFLFYASAFYFAYTFITKRDLPFVGKIGLIALIVPVIALLPTARVLKGIDVAYCNALETNFIILYSYAFEILLSLTLLFVAFLCTHQKPARAKEIGFFTLGTLCFLLAFSSGNIIGSITDDWALAQIGLFGMPIFVAFLAYTAVKFKAFNLKLFGAQVLVMALWLLTLSLLFIRTMDHIRLVVMANLVLFTGLGFLLVRSVKREINQRERIEKLAGELEEANKQQVVLIHFITHQIKGFVAKSRNIFAMIREGDYGPVPDTMRPMIEEGFRSDSQGAETIQNILNASNIKSGKVSYNMQPFDLKKLVDDIVATLKPLASGKGLDLLHDTGRESLTCIGDRVHLENAFKNLIDNSIKYTPTGSVKVILKKIGATVRLEIQDTGVGITPEDMQNLFTEGGHGKESQKVNVESTGFGLYIVKNIIAAHKGKVWAESDGHEKGSRFIVELPI